MIHLIKFTNRNLIPSIWLLVIWFMAVSLVLMPLRSFGQTSSDAVQIRLQVGDPVVTPSSNGGGGGSQNKFDDDYNISLDNIEVGTNQIKVKWSSQVSTKVITRWGTSQRVDQGVSGATEFARFGEIVLNNLESGKQYWIELEFENRSGTTRQLRIPITTVKEIEIDQQKKPANEFSAVKTNQAIVLTWQKTEDDVMVRIVQTNNSFARDPFDGRVVYEGGAEEFTHQIDVDEPVFYTLFQRFDGSNTFSNGIGQVILPDSGANNSSSSQDLISRIQELLFNQPQNNILPSQQNNSATSSQNVSIEFCREIGSSDGVCQSTKVYEVRAGADFVVLTDFPPSIDPDIVTINLYETGLTQQTKIYLLERDDDGVWKVAVPNVAEGQYDFSLQAYDRNGELLFSENGSLRATTNLNVANAGGTNQTTDKFLLWYIAGMNFAFLVMIGFLIYRITNNRKKF